MQILTECVNNSTAHGVSHMTGGSNNTVTKLVWIVIVLSASGVFILHSSSLVLKYFRYETSVSIQLEGSSFILPDIFVCNMIPFSYSLMNYNLMTNNPDYHNLSMFLYRDQQASTNLRENIFIKEYSNEFIDHVLSNRNFTDIISVNFKNVKDVNEIFIRVPHSKYRSCYKIKDKFKHLMYKNDKFIFTMYTDTHWFMSKNYEKVLRIKRDPRLISSYKLMRNLRRTHTLYITPKNHYPHFDSLSIPLELGKITDIHITMELHKRINKESNSCRQKPKKITYFNHLEPRDPIEYDETPIDCLYQQFQNSMIQKKKCIVPHYPVTPEQWNNSRVTLCTSSFKELEESIIQETTIRKKMNKEPSYLSCRKLVNCEVPVYEAEIHKWTFNWEDVEKFVRWAYYRNRTMYGALLSKFNELKQSKVTEIKEYLKNYYSIENSFIQLSFYFPHLHSTVYTESFSYELKSLLSDIGGIMGFYLGISFVTLFELLAFSVKFWSQSHNKFSPSTDLNLEPPNNKEDPPEENNKLCVTPCNSISHC